MGYISGKSANKQAGKYLNSVLGRGRGSAPTPHSENYYFDLWRAQGMPMAFTEWMKGQLEIEAKGREAAAALSRLKKRPT